MKRLSRTAAAALVAGTMGFTAFAPIAFAQDQTITQAPAVKAPGENAGPQRPGRPQFNFGRNHERGQGMDKAMMGRGMLELVCSPRGAERLEHMFVSISHRVTLTDAQKPAFESLKTAALSAQTDFADTCKAAIDAVRADGKPDMVKALQTRLAIDTAKVEALTAMLPKFEDFYTGLSAEQKATLEPSGRHQGFNGERRHGKPGDHQGPKHPRPGMQQPGPADADNNDEPDDAEG